MGEFHAGRQRHFWPRAESSVHPDGLAGDSDVVFDEEFGAGVGLVVELRFGDAAQVAPDVSPQLLVDRHHIAGLDDLLQQAGASFDQAVVVVVFRQLVLGLLAPFVVAQEVVERVCGGFVFFPSLCLTEGFDQELFLGVRR